MRKILNTALIMITCMGVFTACGKIEKAGVSETSESQKEETIAEKIEDAVEEVVEESDWAAPEAFDTSYNIDETVLYDNNGVVIKALGITYDSYKVSLNVSMENNTDKKLDFTAETLGYSANAVNGYMIQDGWMSCDVEPGATETDEISFSTMQLQLYGINAIADIQVGFRVVDDDYDDFITGPLSVETALASKYDYEKSGYKDAITGKALQYTYGYEVPYFSEDKIYSSNGVEIVSECYMVNKDGDGILTFEVKNGSDQDITFMTKDITINDTLAYEGSWSYQTITKGKKMIIDIDASRVCEIYAEENEPIEDISSVGFALEARNAEGIVMSEPKTVTITVK